MEFSGKTVLITGAGAGIGRAAAAAFAQRGAKVAVNALHTESAGETVRRIREAGGEAEAFPGDVSDPDTARRLAAQTVERFGSLDILVNNAGIVLGGTVDELSEEDWERTMQVNLFGAFLLCKYGVRQMLTQGGGAIVNIASAAALRGLASRAAYSASKGALLSLSRAMAADYRTRNIRVNCVCPGTILTPSLEQRIAQSPDPEQAARDFAARQPVGRLGTPDEAAYSILFAASPQNGFMTGAVLTPDGGMCI